VRWFIDAVLRIGDFTATLDKTAATLTGGQSTTFNVTLASVNHYTSSITVFCQSPGEYRDLHSNADRWVSPARNVKWRLVYKIGLGSYCPEALVLLSEILECHKEITQGFLYRVGMISAVRPLKCDQDRNRPQNCLCNKNICRIVLRAAWLKKLSRRGSVCRVAGACRYSALASIRHLLQKHRREYRLWPVLRNSYSG